MNRRYILCLALLGGLALASFSSAAGQAATVRSLDVSSVVLASGEAMGGRDSLSSSALSSTTFLPLIVRDYDRALFPNCRYGIAAWDYMMVHFDIASILGAGWRLNFYTAQSPVGAPRVEFAQMIRLSQDRGGSEVCGPDYGYAINPSTATLTTRVLANPGSLWIIGNEMDRVGQDGVCPQQYAEAYHDLYYRIKNLDPAAQVAVGGLVEVTPARMQYLDIVWNTYLQKYGAPMPVDVWTMHIYILSESNNGDAYIALGTDPRLAIPPSFDCADPNSICHAEHDDMDLFIEQVVRMRQWMKAHGQQDRPLLLSEYSLLKPYHFYGTCTIERCPPLPEEPEGCFCDENRETFHPRRVAEFMEATFDYLETARDPALGYPADDYRLVQQWLWFSLWVDDLAAAHCSNLIVGDTYALTIPGQQFRNHVAAIPPEVNLFPVRAASVVARALDGTSPVTVTLAVEVVNNGNTILNGPVLVTFYSDEAMTAPVGSAALADLGGCARRTTVATTTWASLDTGPHPFWVEVDSGGQAAETRETDNVTRGIVLVNPRQVFLPTLLRNR